MALEFAFFCFFCINSDPKNQQKKKTKQKNGSIYRDRQKKKTTHTLCTQCKLGGPQTRGVLPPPQHPVPFDTERSDEWWGG